MWGRPGVTWQNRQQHLPVEDVTAKQNYEFERQNGFYWNHDTGQRLSFSDNIL
jgi:hypothetical protein